jgi:hypothetical protein
MWITRDNLVIGCVNFIFERLFGCMYTELVTIGVIRTVIAIVHNYIPKESYCVVYLNNTENVCNIQDNYAPIQDNIPSPRKYIESYFTWTCTVHSCSFSLPGY